MSRLSSPTAVRVNRRHYVNVDSQTVRDDSLDYRALGLLTYLLDQSEGWQVRSEQLSKPKGREGRTAVRASLRKLASAGYYRLERRRLLDNSIVMGTSVSEYPVPQWIEDDKLFCTTKDPAVPVVEQEDGTFLVAYPDGTFGSDGFTVPVNDEEPPADLDEPEPEPEDGGSDEEPAAVPEPPASSGPRKPPVKVERPPTPGKAPAADAAWTSTECAAHHGISPQAWRKLVSGGFLPQHTALKGARTKVWDAAVAQAVDMEKAIAESAPFAEAAQEVADWWWEDAKKHFGAYVGKSNGFVAMRGMVEKALQAGYTRRECADALRKARQHLPSPQQWQRALGEASNRIAPTQPGGGVKYSDAATWGEPETSPTTTPDASPSGPDNDDDVQFGVVAARK